MVKCPKCGNEVSGDDFCSECGLKLNHTSGCPPKLNFG